MGDEGAEKEERCQKELKQRMRGGGEIDPCSPV